MLEGSNILLRAVEPDDLDFLYRCENDTSVWRYGTTTAPYSRFTLKQYIEEAQALCERVALVNRGKLQKLDTPDALIEELGPFAVDETGDDGLKSKYFHTRDEAIAYLSTAGSNASFRNTTLEDVFVECAGRKIINT